MGGGVISQLSVEQSGQSGAATWRAGSERRDARRKTALTRGPHSVSERKTAREREEEK